jgi:hypothetical protein
MTTFPQEKVFQDGVLFAGRKRTIANPARYGLVNGLRSGSGFNDVIKRIAAWTMNNSHGGPRYALVTDPATRIVLKSLNPRNAGVGISVAGVFVLREIDVQSIYGSPKS